MSSGPLNSSAPTKADIVGGVYNATLPTPSDKQAMALQLDNEGNLLVNVAIGGSGGGTVKIEDTSGAALNSNGSGALNVAVVSGGGSNASVGTVGAAVPSSATTMGIKDGSGNLQIPSLANPVRVDPVGTTTQPVSLPAGQAVELLDSGGTNKASISAAGAVKVDGSAVTQPVSLASTTLTGTSTVAGNLTNNNAAPGATNLGVLPAIANQVAPVSIEGDQVLESQDLAGNTRVIVGGMPTVVQKSAFSSTGSVASLACAFGSNVKKGDTLVIVAAVGNGTTPTITDTLGNTYLQGNGNAGYQLGPASAFGIGVFWCKSKSAGANTITVNNGGATCSIAAEIYELTGLAPGIVPEAFSSISATQASVIIGAASNQTIPNGYMIFGVAVGTAAQTITLPIVNSVPFTEIITNDSGQINPTTPAGLFSFASGSGVSPLPQTFAGNLPIGLLASSEPFASVLVVFRPYINASEGVVGVLGQGNIAASSNIVPVTLANGTSLSDAMNVDGQVSAASSSRGVGVGPLLFNGATWDRQRNILGSSSAGTGIAAVAGAPTVAAAQACLQGNAAALTVLNIKASAGNVFGVSVANPNASTIFLQFYNTAGTPTLGTSVIWWLAIPASTTLNIPPGVMALNNFATGIGIGAATAATGAVAPGTAPSVVIFYA